MNPTELFHADGKPTGIFYCSECRVVQRSKTLAEGCCVNTCADCGKEHDLKYHTLCRACDDKRIAQRERERFEKAEKLKPENYSGPVYVDDDQYHRSLDEYLDNQESSGEEVAEYVWACFERPVCTLDIDH